MPKRWWVPPANTDTIERGRLRWRHVEEHSPLHYCAMQGEYSLCVWSVTGLEWSWAIMRTGLAPVYGKEPERDIVEAMTRAERELAISLERRPAPLVFADGSAFETQPTTPAPPATDTTQRSGHRSRVLVIAVVLGLSLMLWMIGVTLMLLNDAPYWIIAAMGLFLIWAIVVTMRGE